MSTPAVVLAAANVCSKSVWRIKNLPTTPRSPLSAQQQQLVEDSIQDLNTVLASPAFNTAGISSTYDQTQTQGRSPEAIYDLMVSSSPLQLTITLYTDKNPFSGNEGFEDESSPGTAYGNLKAIQSNHRGQALQQKHLYPRAACGAFPELGDNSCTICATCLIRCARCTGRPSSAVS